ncbi:MAG: glycosyltransferase [Halobacteriaceae archaeon]
MSNNVFSVISVYNDENVLQTWLEEGLKRQSFNNFERIFIDNTNSKYSSAAEALNDGGSQATGEYLIFVHQDVRLLSDDFLKNLLEYLEALPKIGIGGVAGMVANEENEVMSGRNVVYHGSPPKEYENFTPYELENHDQSELPIKHIFSEYDHPNQTRFWSGGNPINQPVPVQTLDELLLVIPNQIFKEHKFDERICTGWHLYGVEYCLRMKYRHGLDPYVFPLQVWHKSDGSPLNNDYFRTYHKLVKEYDDIGIDSVHMTTGIRPLSVQYSYPRRWKTIRKLLKPIRYTKTGKFLKNFKSVWKEPNLLVDFLKWKIR